MYHPIGKRYRLGFWALVKATLEEYHYSPEYNVQGYPQMLLIVKIYMPSLSVVYADLTRIIF
jgi:hypothetical protein